MAKEKAKWKQENDTKKLQTVTEYCYIICTNNEIKRIKQLKLRVVTC